MAVEFTVHDQGLLLVQRETVKCWVGRKLRAVTWGVPIVDASGGIFDIGHGWVQGHELVRRGRGGGGGGSS